MNSRNTISSLSSQAAASPAILSFLMFWAMLLGIAARSQEDRYGSFLSLPVSAFTSSFTEQTIPSRGETKSIFLFPWTTVKAFSPCRGSAPGRSAVRIAGTASPAFSFALLLHIRYASSMRRKVAIVASTRMSTMSITSLSEEQGDDPAPLRLVQPAADVRKGFSPVRRGDPQVAAEHPVESLRLPVEPLARHAPVIQVRDPFPGGMHREYPPLFVGVAVDGRRVVDHLLVDRADDPVARRHHPGRPVAGVEQEADAVLPHSSAFRREGDAVDPPDEPLRKIVRSHPHLGLVFLPGGNPQVAGMEVVVGAEQEPPHPFRRASGGF